MNGRLDTTGMNNHQINTFMQWQARAEESEREVTKHRDQIERLVACANGLRDILRVEVAHHEMEQANSAEQLATSRELCRLLLNREREIVRALRALVEVLAPQPPTTLRYFSGDAFEKAVREAVEVLAIIDAQKTK